MHETCWQGTELQSPLNQYSTHLAVSRSWGFFFVSALVMRALVFGVYMRALGLWKLPCHCSIQVRGHQGRAQTSCGESSGRWLFSGSSASRRDKRACPFRIAATQVIGEYNNVYTYVYIYMYKYPYIYIYIFVYMYTYIQRHEQLLGHAHRKLTSWALMGLRNISMPVAFQDGKPRLDSRKSQFNPTCNHFFWEWGCVCRLST